MHNGECVYSRSLVSAVVILVFSLQSLRLSVQRANVFYFFIEFFKFLVNCFTSSCSMCVFVYVPAIVNLMK